MFHNIVYDFNETQLRPVSDNGSHNMSIFDTIKELKQNQNNMINELNSLSEICRRIDETIKDIKEKLHQYDIDGPGETFDDNINEVNCDDYDSNVDDDIMNEMTHVSYTDTTDTKINKDNLETNNLNTINTENTIESHSELVDMKIVNNEPISELVSEQVNIIVPNDIESTPEPEKEVYSYKNKRSYGRRKK
jgi:vacuolar-type H+-ATPase subunit I/STV1